MFGYIKVDKSTIAPNEFGLYHAFFCGLCLSTKKQFGNICRLTTNFDMNCFNVLMHSILNEEVKIEAHTCVASPFKKRSMVVPNELIDKLSVANILLMYYNLLDDVNDEGSAKKKIALKSIKKYFKKAQKIYPEMDQAILTNFNELAVLEKKNCKDLDLICDPFAKMVASFVKIILGEKTSEYAENLGYNLGKWVYLIDALDDLEKDAKKKQFNPLTNCFGECGSAKEFVKKNLDVLNFVFYVTLNKIAECFNDLNLTMYVCVLRNIFFNSIRKTTADIFERYLETKPKEKAKKEQECSQNEQNQCECENQDADCECCDKAQEELQIEQNEEQKGDKQ